MVHRKQRSPKIKRKHKGGAIAAQGTLDRILAEDRPYEGFDMDALHRSIAEKITRGGG